MAKTQNEAIEFAKAKIGTAGNYDGKFGAQCWDLVMFYTNWLGSVAPQVSAAKQWADANWPQGYTKVARPQPGDIAIFGAIPTNQYGHASIVIEVSETEFISVDYNWVNSSPNGSPGARVRHAIVNPKRRMTYIRPPYEQPPRPAQPMNQYTIKAGNTFWALEAGNNWPHGTLQSMNPGVDPKALKVGQVINIPQAQALPTTTHQTPPQQRTYTVQPNDTLWKIAEKTGYGGAAYMQIYERNKAIIGGNPNLIKVGQELVLP